MKSFRHYFGEAWLLRTKVLRDRAESENCGRDYGSPFAHYRQLIYVSSLLGWRGVECLGPRTLVHAGSIIQVPLSLRSRCSIWAISLARSTSMHHLTLGTFHIAGLASDRTSERSSDF